MEAAKVFCIGLTSCLYRRSSSQKRTWKHNQKPILLVMCSEKCIAAQQLQIRRVGPHGSRRARGGFLSFRLCVASSSTFPFLTPHCALRDPSIEKGL